MATRPADVLMELIEGFFPAGTGEMDRFREELLAFINDPLGKRVLLTGPSGIGKTLTARVIAMGRSLVALADNAALAENAGAMAPLSNATTIAAQLRKIIRSGRLPDYHVECAVTGLVETLADSQLFGMVSGTASDTVNRLGIFEHL